MSDFTASNNAVFKIDKKETPAEKNGSIFLHFNPTLWIAI